MPTLSSATTNVPRNMCASTLLPELQILPGIRCSVQSRSPGSNVVVAQRLQLSSLIYRNYGFAIGGRWGKYPELEIEVGGDDNRSPE